METPDDRKIGTPNNQEEERIDEGAPGPRRDRVPWVKPTIENKISTARGIEGNPGLGHDAGVLTAS